MKKILFILAFSAAAFALADTCTSVTIGQAIAAKNIIEAQAASRMGTADESIPTTIVSFVEDSAGSKPTMIEVGSVQISSSLGGHALMSGSATVNVVDTAGKTYNLDLAYAFLQVGHSLQPVRLAPLVGCAYQLGTATDVLN